MRDCTAAVSYTHLDVYKRQDMSRLMSTIDVGEAEKLDTRQKISIGALIALMALTILPSCLPQGPVKMFMSRLGTTACVLLIVAFVTFLRGKMCIRDSSGPGKPDRISIQGIDSHP